MTIQIEKHVRPPRNHRGPPRKYPFDIMKVGDSFIVETHEQRLSAQICARHEGYKVRTTKETVGYRIWMVGIVPPARVGGRYVRKAQRKMA